MKVKTVLAGFLCQCQYRSQMNLSGHTRTKLTSYFITLTPPPPTSLPENGARSVIDQMFLSSHRAARHCCCMMGRLQRGAQSISLTGAAVHYVSEMTPKTSHNPWVRFSPPCRSGALIFISSCPSSRPLMHCLISSSPIFC